MTQRKRWSLRRSSLRSPRRLRLAAEPLEARQMLAADPVISEFMADNDKTLSDGDGNSPDWIEIQNAGDTAIDLAGWYLTDRADNLTKWTFPSTELQPGAFLVVFASAQDVDNYVDAGGNLHTNFSLSRDGEYLALVEPDGTTIASEFGAGGMFFPPQFEDVSHGAGREVTETPLLAAGAAAESLIPTDDSLGTAWTLPGFTTDASWISGTTGVGFSDSIDGLEFWLKAEHIVGLSSGDPVTLWADSSGQGNDAVQAGKSAQPIWIDNAIGDMAVVRFDGEDDVLRSTSLQIGADTTVFFVTKNSQQTTTGSFHRGVLTVDNNPYRGDGNGYGFGYQRGNVSGFGISLGLGSGGSSEQRFSNSAPADEQFEVFAYRKSNGAAQLWRDGLLVSSGTQNDPAGGYATGYNIGADLSLASREYQGDIAEIMVFDRSLSDEQFAAVLGYLDQEYALGGDPVDPPPEPPERGLVSFWNFDDGTITDQVGTIDAAANVGATFSPDTPAAGGAGSLDLTGTANYVTLPEFDYGITNEYTLSAWVKPDVATGGRFFSIQRDLTSGGGDRAGVNFGLSADNKLFSGVITPPGPNAADFNDISAQTLSAPAGQWSHVAVTLQNDVITMYVNGIAETDYINSGSPNNGQLKTTGNDVDFDDQNGSFSGFGADGRGGSLPGDLSNFFSGLLDDVAVFNAALPAETIALLAQGDAPESVPIPDPVDPPPPEPSNRRLVSYWNFDDGLTVTDQVGGNNGIALNNGATFSTDTPAAGGANSLDLTNGSDYVTLPAVDYDITNQYTISAWVRRNGSGSGRFFAVKRDLTSSGGDRSGIAFGLSGDKVYAGLISSVGVDSANTGDTFHDYSTTSTSTTGVPEDTWTHVAVTLQNDFITMYVNGVAETVYSPGGGAGNADGKLKVSGQNIDFVDANGSFSGFGADGNAPAHGSSAGDFTRVFYDGLLDEVAVWNAALAPESIALLAQGDSPTAMPIPDPSDPPDDPDDPPGPLPDVPPADLEGARIASLIGTDLSEPMLGADRLGVNASAYIRIPFEVTDPAAFDSLALRIQYDDAFVAYLNGTEVASRNAPASLQWNSTALSERPAGAATGAELIDISQHLGLLVAGTNVLAIQGLNSSIDDADFFILPELVDIDITELEPRFFNIATPGAANNTGVNNNGPAISSVTHTPAQPTADDDLVVTAQIDPRLHPFASATLTYRVMYGSEVNIPMADDGSGDDAVPGDGIYTATVPSAVFSAGQMVRYYITTTDTLENPARKPEFFRPTQSAKYFGTVVADPSIPATNLQVLEWFVEDPAWHIEGGGNNRDETSASVYFDGRFYDNIRVRVRGGVTQNLAKPNFKFDFYNGGHFQYDTDQRSVEEFNLQSLLGEIATRTYMRNPLAYQLFRDSGTAAPYSNYTHVRQNGQFYSLAAMEEQVDENFLKRNGLNPEGVLYKAKSGAMLQTNPTPGQWVKGTRQDEDFSDLAAFTEGLILADPTERAQFVFDNVNLPQVIHYLAITALGPNHDRITHNYYMYRDTNETGEWSVFPWDLDRWFPQGDLLTNPVSSTIFYGDSDNPRWPGTPTDRYNRLNDAIFDIPETREMYVTHLRSVVDQWMNSTYLEDSVDAIASLIALDAALDNAKWGVGSLNAGVAAIKNTIATRRAQLAGDANIPPSDIITSTRALLDSGAAASVLVPTDDLLTTAWTGQAYAEGSQGETWTTGTTGVGYERGTGYEALIGTDVEAEMFDLQTSVYVRAEFEFDGVLSFDQLQLRMRYDDAFVAYLNGTEIARSANLSPGTPAFDALTLGGNHEATTFEEFDVADFATLLTTGTNVLAVHGINRSVGSSDMLVLPELVTITLEAVDPDGPEIVFGTIDFNPESGNQDEEYITLVNNGQRGVDISGWQLTGGVAHTFQVGTVIPVGGTMYVSPDVAAFRNRRAGPSGGQGLFVQGGYQGHISNFGETIDLVDPLGTTIATVTTPSMPSDVQQFLRITELHYNPPGIGDPTEFIELRNTSSGAQAVTLDLTGVRISDGPSEPFEFTLSNVRSLAPGDYMLVVKNQAAFMAAYDSVDPAIIAGEFAGSLSNGGERIKIEDADNSTVVEFEYENGNDPLTEADWHAETDGNGFSLVVLDVNADTNLGTNWRSSAMIGGSPGSVDPQPLLGNFNGDTSVNRGDAVRLLANLGRTGNSHRARGDADQDRATTLADLALLQSGLGATHAAPSPAPLSRVEAIDAHFSRLAQQPAREGRAIRASSRGRRPSRESQLSVNDTSRSIIDSRPSHTASRLDRRLLRARRMSLRHYRDSESQ